MLTSAGMSTQGAESFGNRIVRFTEGFLTRRKRRRFRKKQKQKKKNVIVDWVEAFLWAAVVVLLVNQYLLQAYQIPSGSMRNTLLEEDRIFVNKIIYGPELAPGVVKLPGFAEPERGEVIIFENPDYIGRGPVFDIVQRILYMLTLSLVDIDRDERGNPRAHFLIKRAVGVEGDRLKSEDGNLFVQPRGTGRWYPEEEFQRYVGLSYPVARMLSPQNYRLMEAYRTALVRRDAGLELSDADQEALQLGRATVDMDVPAEDRATYKEEFRIDPAAVRTSGRRYQRLDVGWYVPTSRVMPLGDNRDNSRDGRYFGPVKERFVLGRAMFKYWPLGRIGPIH